MTDKMTRAQMVRLAHDRPELRAKLVSILRKTAASIPSPSLLVPGKRPQPIEPKNGKNFQLPELQKYVGGYINIVYLPGNMVLVVDDEGMMKGLPVNRDASKLARQLLVGPAVYCPKSMVR